MKKSTGHGVSSQPLKRIAIRKYCYSILIERDLPHELLQYLRDSGFWDYARNGRVCVELSADGTWKWELILHSLPPNKSRRKRFLAQTLHVKR